MRVAKREPREFKRWQATERRGVMEIEELKETRGERKGGAGCGLTKVGREFTGNDTKGYRNCQYIK
jgi:hypothetical protein